MSEFKETTREIREWIDNVGNFVDSGVDLLFPSSEEELMSAEKEFKKCKKICRVIGIIVLAICVVIIYVHLKG